MALQTVVISPVTRHTATVIFLHGLGDTGHGWSEGLKEIRLPHVKYLCPTAFDLYTLQPGGREDEKGIKEQAQKEMISNEEKSGIPSNRIVIGGFSQGGALALYSALTTPKPLAGVVALSCWLPLHNTFPGAIQGNVNTSMMQCHGEADPMVPYPIGQMTNSELKKFCTNIQFKTYKGLGHSSSAQEMKDIQTWINNVLPQV